MTIKSYKRWRRNLLVLPALWTSELLFIPVAILAAMIARCRTRAIEVGIGPDPLVSHIYQKRAMQLAGYRVETFTGTPYYITQEFDSIFHYKLKFTNVFLSKYLMYFHVIFRFRAVYIYFNGGPLGLTSLLWRLEPYFYKIAGVKVVTMPYGADVYDMTRARNLLFKHSINLDYPTNRSRGQAVRARVDLWTRRADHIIAGCDWVDFLDFWHTLTLTHFVIDTEEWAPKEAADGDTQRPLRILHAPNHRNVKGTKFFVQAVDELGAEGEAVELVLLERVHNRKIKEAMETVDVVADQLIIGWYAIFALEAMAMGKPVLCYLRPDLERFYTDVGLVEPGELPIVNVRPETVKEVIRSLVRDRERLRELGRRSRSFVLRCHSLPAAAALFDAINRSIGVYPSRHEELSRLTLHRSVR
jgi:hypothetical protein